MEERVDLLSLLKAKEECLFTKIDKNQMADIASSLDETKLQNDCSTVKKSFK